MPVYAASVMSDSPVDKRMAGIVAPSEIKVKLTDIEKVSEEQSNLSHSQPNTPRYLESPKQSSKQSPELEKSLGIYE